MSNAQKPAAPSQALEDAMADALAAVERVEKKRGGSGDVAGKSSAKSGSPQPAAPGDASEASPATTIEVEAAEAGAPQVPVVAPAEAELKDQLLRLAADFDNYRKRATRQMEETRKFGSEAVLASMLAVLDNFDRALAHAKDDTSPLIQGVRMVAKQLTDIMGQHGVKGFPSLGQVFDPERHEAVGQIPSADKPAGTILEEVVKGYMIHDRLLRAAQVMVAAAPTTAGGGEKGADGGSGNGGGAPTA